jgi:hypothetical protein
MSEARFVQYSQLVYYLEPNLNGSLLTDSPVTIPNFTQVLPKFFHYYVGNPMTLSKSNELILAILLQFLEHNHF